MTMAPPDVFRKNDSPFDGRLRLLSEEDVKVLRKDDGLSPRQPCENGVFSQILKSRSFTHMLQYTHTVLSVFSPNMYTISTS